MLCAYCNSKQYFWYIISGGSQQQQQLQQLLLAVSQPSIFNDERDALIAKWNALQALWGAGRGYYNQQGQYVDFARSNPFCAFKVRIVYAFYF